MGAAAEGQQRCKLSHLSALSQDVSHISPRDGKMAATVPRAMSLQNIIPSTRGEPEEEDPFPPPALSFISCENFPMSGQ